MIVSSIKKNT